MGKEAREVGEVGAATGRVVRVHEVMGGGAMVHEVMVGGETVHEENETIFYSPSSPL